MTTLSLIIIEEAELENLFRRVLKEYNAADQTKQGTNPSKALLTVNETCELLSITRVTLHAWKRAGRLPYHRIGHRVYFKEEEIMAAMRTVGGRAG